MRRTGIATPAVTSIVLILICGDSCANTVPTDWDQAVQTAGYVVFRHNNLELVEPSHVPSPLDVATTLRGDLARGEYDPLQIGIHAVADDVKNVRLEVEFDLNVRIFRGNVSPPSDRNPIPGWIHRACLDESSVIESVEKGKSGLFWIVVHAPGDATPGVHRGRIRITSDRAGAQAPTATEIDLEVCVRPFVLQRARIAFWAYFYVNWSPAPLPAFATSDQWLGRIYRNMAEHGHTSVNFYGAGHQIDLRSGLPPPQTRYTTRLFPLARKVGLTSPDIPCFSWVNHLGGPEGGDDDPTSLEQKKRGAAWLRDECRRQGWPELVRYGFDEPGYPTGHGPRLEEDLRPFREVPMRVGTAMYPDSAYGLSELHDVWIVYAGRITPQMRAEAERLGAEVWTYTCHTYPIYPIRSRFFAGLYTWAHRLRGNTFWHYYGQHGYKFVWMRPTDKDPMPTVGWETRRDGIDDYRALQMLEDSIAAHPTTPAAAEARNWLESLRKRLVGVDPHWIEHRLPRDEPLALDEYDRIKSKAFDYIERLGVVPARPAEGAWPRGVKDEARAFRGQSVQNCIEGLTNSDAAVRRSAAWALVEMGREAAPATGDLAATLGDEQVRMPALRALEAIGPEAFAAVPQIRKLLGHEDAYVRMGAVFALGGIGAPWKAQWLRDHNRFEDADKEAATVRPLAPSQLQAVAEALVEGFEDDVLWVAKAATEGLVRMGPAARPALSLAIDLLDRPNDNWAWEAGTVRMVIAAIGPEAVAAAPKLIDKLEGETGRSGRDELMALAAIGPSVHAAIPVIEKYIERTAGDTLQIGIAHYALFCIRGETQDLEGMMDFFKQGDHLAVHRQIPGRAGGQGETHGRRSAANARPEGVRPISREAEALPRESRPGTGAGSGCELVMRAAPARVHSSQTGIHRGYGQVMSRTRLLRTCRKSLSCKCGREDSNLHGVLTPPGPKPGASANSATPARLGRHGGTKESSRYWLVRGRGGCGTIALKL